MPDGLPNSRTRRIHHCLSDYLVIYSSTWEEHLQHLHQVFQRLQNAGLTAKLKKCQFAMQQCRYLGQIAGNGTVQLEQGKLATEQMLSIPETKIEDLFAIMLMLLYHSLIGIMTSMQIKGNFLTQLRVSIIVHMYWMMKTAVKRPCHGYMNMLTRKVNQT